MVRRSESSTCLYFEEIGEQDSAPVADSPIGDLAFLEQLHEVGPRHVEQVCSLLGGQLGMHRRDGDGVAVGDLGQDVNEQVERMPWNLQSGVGVVCLERDRSGVHRGVPTEKPIQDVDRVGRLACCGLIGDRELMIQYSRGCHFLASSDPCVASRGHGEYVDRLLGACIVSDIQHIRNIIIIRAK